MGTHGFYLALSRAGAQRAVGLATRGWELHCTAASPFRWPQLDTMGLVCMVFKIHLVMEGILHLAFWTWTGHDTGISRELSNMPVDAVPRRSFQFHNLAAKH